MKRLCFIFGFLCLLANLAVAQPKSVEYEKKDFLLNVLWNPTFCLEDFREVGLTSSNTELRPMNDYLTSKMPELHSQMLKIMGKDVERLSITKLRLHGGHLKKYNMQAEHVTMGTHMDTNLQNTRVQV